MTFERYMEINRLADSIVAAAGGCGSPSAQTIEKMTDRERKVLNGMIFNCEGCRRWRDCRDLSTVQPRSKAAHLCVHCRAPA